MSRACKTCDKPCQSEYCFAHKPRKPLVTSKPMDRGTKRIKPVSDKTAKLQKVTRKNWMQLNPPDENGEWTCYLQIHPNCPKKVNRETLNREHKLSKVRHPELRYDASNMAAACSWCNKLKGSRDYIDGKLVQGETYGRNESRWSESCRH